MPAVKKLTAPDPRTCPVPFMSEVVTLTYDRNAATPARIRKALEAVQQSAAATDEERQAEALVRNAESLAEVILDWDITETDAKSSPKLAISAEELLELPLTFHNAVWQAIREDNRPPGESSGSFGTG